MAKILLKMTGSSLLPAEAHILRDNATIFYLATAKLGNPMLFKQTADGQTTQLTESDTGSWAISPDEKLLAVQVSDKITHKFQIELRSLARLCPFWKQVMQIKGL